MSINIQNLVNQIQSRYNAIDSNSSLSDINRLTKLHTRKDGAILQGAKQYRSLGQIPTPSGIGDSANVGEIYFVTDNQLDSSGRFYFRSQEGLVHMKTALDSAEDLSITAAASPSPSGSSGFSVASINGSSYGYRVGGGWPAPYARNTIDRYSYSADGNTTDVGDLTGGAKSWIISSSTVDYGYSLGHYPATAAEKYSHTSNSNATQIPALSYPAYFGAGNTSDTNHYYTQWFAQLGSPLFGGPTFNTAVAKVPIANEDAATDTGIDWSAATNSSDGMDVQSHTHAYVMGVGGGNPATSPAASNKIEKFPFAAEDASSDVGDLAYTITTQAKNSNEDTAGYASGGYSTAVVNVIQKMPFATDTNATDIADLTQARHWATGTNSTSYGYVHGGNTGGPAATPGAGVQTIDKFSFSVDGNATDVGDLTTYAAYHAGGTQV